MTFSEKAKKIFSEIWNYIKAAWIELVVLAALLVVDLVLKAIVDATMSVGQSITIIPKFFHITYTRNYNAAFGSAFGLEKLLGPTGVRVALLIITGIAIVFFTVFLVRTRGKHITGRLGLALLVSGALGNFVDRLALGYVRDFVEIEYFGLNLPLIGSRFAIFNIADVGVTVGVVLFLVYIIFFSDWAKKADETEEKSKSEYVLLDDDSVGNEKAVNENSNSTSDGGRENETENAHGQAVANDE